MTRLGLFSVALALLVCSAWLSGCSEDDSVSGNAQAQPYLVSISPEDGATGVPTAGPIVMAFNTPMDMASVMGHFHCSGGDEMWEWMDSLQHHGPGPGGHMADMNHMMEWMRDIEHKGQFEWNDEMTECVFRPDPALSARTDYMIYLEGEIHGHGGKMMDMHHLRYGGYMIHFRTGP